MSTPDAGDTTVTAPPRILLVEDNDAASKGLAKILLTLGFSVKVVSDGTTALEALQSAPPPEFVLTDLRLPDLDGREVAQFASQLRPKPKVVLITGWDLDSELQHSASWGVDWVLSKPLNVYELIEKLSATAGNPVPPDGETSTDASRTP